MIAEIFGEKGARKSFTQYGATLILLATAFGLLPQGAMDDVQSTVVGINRHLVEMRRELPTNGEIPTAATILGAVGMGLGLRRKSQKVDNGVQELKDEVARLTKMLDIAGDLGGSNDH